MYYYKIKRSAVFIYLGMVTHFVNLYEKWSRNSVLRIWIGPLPFFVLGGAESAEVLNSDQSWIFVFLI